MSESVKHHPSLYETGRHGCWCHCECGWKSQLYTTTVGAHLAFAAHLAVATHATTPHQTRDVAP